MTTRPHSSFKIVFILGLLAMLMPLSIDMYLPALPVISAQFGVPAGSAQMTLSTYILGFALGQLFFTGKHIAIICRTFVCGIYKFVCMLNVSVRKVTVTLYCIYETRLFPYASEQLL